MATALAAQLAQIRARSSNSLDLRAQKKAHSQSLLFDPAVAVTQDFDTIYQICYEGFEELCHLDSRFSGFAGSIFGEQSKQEDRSQMTAAQNQQLDGVLEKILSLVGSKLLLKPAIKVVEWLVRRFRVHEHNTLCLVLSFLPLHATPVFATLLSILPQRIPSTLKFLHPYMQSLANPPRHAIAYTASNSRPFFTALSTYILNSGRLGYHYPALISFWASIVTEAVASMLDQTRSANLGAQGQNQEDAILFLLPVLNEGLTMDGAHEIRIGCYMVLTVLVSKADLGDDVISALMEAVTSNWTQTSHAGLICLSVLAQERESFKLPKSVFTAVMELEKIEDDLLILREQYKVERFTIGLALGVINCLKKAKDAKRVRFLRTVIEAGLMDEASTTVVIEAVISAARSMTPETNPKFDVQGSLADLILRLADTNSIRKLIQTIVMKSELNDGQIDKMLHRILQRDEGTPTLMSEDAEMGDVALPTVTKDFETLISRIPTRTAYEISFLSHSDSYVFGSLENAFIAISGSKKDVEKFANLPVLRKSLAMSEPLFLSFFIRIWCSNSSATARAVAIQSVSSYFEAEPLAADVQIVLPYLLFALADQSPKVRRAATGLVLSLVSAYAKAKEDVKSIGKLSILGQAQVYGQGKETQELSWLTVNETYRFLAEVLVPGLEECLIDERHLSQLLSDNINVFKHSKSANTIHKVWKTSLRLAILSSLCSHVVNTPLYVVKFRLLQILNQVPKVGSTSRTKLLLPLLLEIASQNEEEQQRNCHMENIDPLQFLDRVVNIVTPADREGIQALKAIIQSGDRPRSPVLRTTTLRHIQIIWPSMKSDLQESFAKMLLEQAVGNTKHQADDDQIGGAMETLRALPLPTAILQSLLESLPRISLGLQDKPPASKRRRTSHGQSMDAVSPSATQLSQKLRQITTVLEIVEGSKAERQPELLKGLFQVFSDLQHSASHSYKGTGYLQLLTMDCMIAIVKKTDNLSTLRTDQSAIQADVLVECIRSTESPQVRNTALLLLSALATAAPALILHSVMPIFTFMGVNVLHQDDEFSVYVVKQTMESVIPRLVQSLHQRREGPFAGVSELLLSFAGAFGHIPTQRRLDLFTSLADKVGPSDYLFALLAIMLDKYPNNPKVVHFATDLTGRYGVKIRLQTMERYLQVILDIFKPKRTISSRLLTFDRGHTADDAVAYLLPLVVAVLSDRSLIVKMSIIFRNKEKGAGTIQSCYETVLEEIFRLAEQCKSNKMVYALCVQALDATLGLLPLSKLVVALQDLLGRSEDNIRRQVLQSFEQRLNDKNSNQKDSQTACLSFLSQLISVIETTSDVSLRQTAIACVDLITEKFGKKDVSAVLVTAQTISGEKCIGAAENRLRAIALLCLATMIEVAGDMFVAVIPKTFKIAIDHLTASIEEHTEDESLHNAAYSFLGALLTYVPWVITGADLDQLLIGSYQSANAEMGEICNESRAEALSLVPIRVESKDCFAALARTWPSAMTEGPMAVKEHLRILRQAIDRQPKSTIIKHLDILGSLFLKIFDLRHIQLSPPTEDSYDPDEIDEVEDLVNEIVIAMIYKLNDATFRPLFLRIREWSTTPASKRHRATVHRRTTWFAFLLKFFDTLKSIVTSYAGLIIDDTVEILGALSPEDEASTELWHRVVRTLSKTFEHDQDDFYQAPAHFNPVATALLSQLARAAAIDLLPELIPAIAELAAATDSSAHHKEMNAAILKYMRSDSAAVRLAAVHCQWALTEKLGEEWLALLPEMLPFISEALEDDDEGVEKEVQRWVGGIESVLGESLDPMLQ